MKKTVFAAFAALLVAAGRRANAVDEIAPPEAASGENAAGCAAEWNAALLWYESPAQKWTDALPIGNGQMGAMVFGGVEEERLQAHVYKGGCRFPARDTQVGCLREEGGSG